MIEDAHHSVVVLFTELWKEEAVSDSSRIMMLDSAITLRLELCAIYEHEERAAPLADARTVRYAALCTVIDLILAMLRFRHSDWRWHSRALNCTHEWARSAGGGFSGDDERETCCTCANTIR